MSTWELKDCYLIVDMERLNYEQYFQRDFRCPDLDDFFSDISTPKKIFQNRENINEFFDKLLDVTNIQKSLYVRFKWLTYLHSIFKNFSSQSVMFTYIMKALHIYLDKATIFYDKYGPYEQYLVSVLFKPYLQYLIKLCTLNLDQQNDKENQTSNISYSPKLSKWYREYNFVHWAGQTFSVILKEFKNFFCSKFPYLNEIGSQIYRDINNIISNLKGRYNSLKSLNVSLMELDKLEERITDSYQDHMCFTRDYEYQLCSQIKDYSKADISDFLTSPMKDINTTQTSIKVHSPFTIQQPNAQL